MLASGFTWLPLLASFLCNVCWLRVLHEDPPSSTESLKKLLPSLIVAKLIGCVLLKLLRRPRRELPAEAGMPT